MLPCLGGPDLAHEPFPGSIYS
jgi:hypothetical protein